ncbi:hypothetical protein [Caproiciproducens sp. CPB-2]|uniref:hypothetical protein n=1 Tax=Caproiciproducens sp. CPB-2 TaxID=3030017 RepID=UPI0023DCC24D|nr:hypothetical protein [Caproiciproducens sp. CPB-2]MDF1493179.1 hypothetical protein [Caproiciproducens sp. CPB-2]
MTGKLPPIEKLYEAYSAIADGRVSLREGEAEVVSSDGSKAYKVVWQGNTYSSGDNATYWQGYPGYPILAVLMLQGKLPMNPEIAGCFRGINWRCLNAKHRADYASAAAEVFQKQIPEAKAEAIRETVRQAYEELKKLELTVKRGKRAQSFSSRSLAAEEEGCSR